MSSKILSHIHIFLSIFLLTVFSATNPSYATENIRIVSLSPSITHNILQMGAGDLIVGRTSYCPGSDENRNQIIGNVLEVQVEKIMALRPDIVFCMSFTKPEVIRKLENLGIKVYNLSTPKSLDEIFSQARFIGQEIGFGKEAAEMVRNEESKITEIRHRFGSGKTKAYRTFFQIGSNPVFPVIKGTFMQEYLDILGLDNIVDNYKGGGISKEYVIASGPEIMIISKMSGMGEHVMKEWLTFENIPAVRQKRIFLIDDTKACCPSPIFFRETLETIAGYLETWK